VGEAQKLTKTQSPSWNPRVEGLRGVSILLVFFAHINPDFKHKWGTLGVAIFFIISGYVITGSISRQISASTSHELILIIFLKKFYVRRARRLLPLAITIILLTLFTSLFDSSADKKQYILSAIFCLLYVGNIFGYTFGYTDLAPAIGHFWSLAVEEQFYFIWPILYFYAFKKFDRKMNTTKWAFIGILVITLSHPLIAATGKTPYTLPTTYFDLLLMGCCMSLMKDKIEELKGIRVIFINCVGFLSFLIIILSSSSFITSTSSLFYYNFNALLASSVFLFALKSNIFNRKVLRFFGKISYSLYCIHWPLFYFWRTFIGGGFFSMAAAGALSILISLLSQRYFETKFYQPTV
jgi:peptidoglycan/LPS O-acetylase OafA/YrhL